MPRSSKRPLTTARPATDGRPLARRTLLLGLLALAVLIGAAIWLGSRLWQPAAVAPSDPEVSMTRSSETTSLALAGQRKAADTATASRPTATPSSTPTETPRPRQTSTRTPAPTRSPSATPTALNELYERINRIRRDANLAELTLAADLIEAAQAHAADMTSRQTLSHTGADGSDVGARIRRTGYKPTAWGEIIASVTGGPAQAVTVWWNSAAHRAIMLNPDFREFGAGRAAPASDPLEYYAVVFGRQ